MDPGERRDRDDQCGAGVTTWPPAARTWQRKELLGLLSLSGTLAGLSVTSVTWFHTLVRSTVSQSIADDTLAVAAVLFLAST